MAAVVCDECPGSGITGLHALERDRILADKVVANEFVVQHDEAHQRQFGMVDVELETFLEQRTVTLVGYSVSFLF